MASTPGGILFARPAAMSGATARKALRRRFDAIRRAELERLQKKLRGLSEADRRSAEAIIADVVQAIARVPDQAPSDDVPALLALVHLFDLEADSTRSGL